MTWNTITLAQSALFALGNPFRWFTSTTMEIVVVCGALWLVSMALVIWVLFFRSKRHHHLHQHHHGHKRPVQPEGEAEADSSHRHRRRRRRREHRPMNPTLAQTGGLPPVRSERRSEPPA